MSELATYGRFCPNLVKLSARLSAKVWPICQMDRTRWRPIIRLNLADRPLNKNQVEMRISLKTSEHLRDRLLGPLGPIFVRTPSARAKRSE